MAHSVNPRHRGGRAVVVNHRACRADPREHGRQGARSKRDRARRAGQQTTESATLAPPQAASDPIEENSATQDCDVS